MLSVIFLSIVAPFASAAPLGEAPDLTHKHYTRLERLGSNTTAYLVHSQVAKKKYGHATPGDIFTSLHFIPNMNRHN